MNRILVNILGCLLAASCWGSSILLLATVGALICFLLFEKKRISVRIALSIFLACLFFDSSLSGCSSLAALSLIIGSYRKEAACLLFSQLPLLLSPIVKLPIFVVHPICALSLYGLFFALCYYTKKNRFPIKEITIIAYGSFLIVLSFSSWELNPAPSTSSPQGYGIGDAITKLTNKVSLPTGQIVYNNTSYQEVVPSGSLYLDHDAKSQWDTGNFRQSRPWGNNLPIASELLKKAIIRDGAWICNLGSSLNPTDAFYIAGFFQNNSITPMIIEHKGSLIFGDSDFAVDCLAPYQRHLIDYLTGSDCYSSLFHISCGLCLIISCFWTQPILVIILLVLNTVFVSIPCHGEVRYVGKKHKWAHTDLGEGVVRVLQQHGINAIFGDNGAKVLVVGAGHTTVHKGERIIILEPDAEVVISGVRYRADSVPLGEVDGLMDARNIIVGGELSNKSILTTNGIIIIATGTPTMLTKEQIWPF